MSGCANFGLPPYGGAKVFGVGCSCAVARLGGAEHELTDDATRTAANAPAASPVSRPRRAIGTELLRIFMTVARS
jgi:hypothetical protein